MFSDLMQHITGYGVIEFKGMGIERALNELEQRGATLWRIERQDRLTVTARAPLSQKKLIRAAMAEMPCRVSWKKSYGLPGLLERLAKRRALMAGLALLIVSSSVAVQFVWRVKITGVDEKRAQEIYDIVQQSGYGPGAFWHTMRLKEVERQLLLKLPDAAGLLANRTGTTLTLEIIPTVPAPEIHTPGEPCDIVANQDGVIVSVTALEGVPQVKQGQAVKKGDVLISGNIVREEGENRAVEARGEVVATVGVTASHTVSMVTDTPQPVGSAYTTRVLQLAGWQVPLQKAPSEADAMLMDTQVRLLSSTFLPARVITQTWQPVQVQSEPRAFEQAEQAAAEVATQNAKALLVEGEQAEQVILQTKLSEDGTQMTVYAIVQTTRSIGEKGALAPVPPTPEPETP